jgi:hypothetical protein
VNGTTQSEARIDRVNRRDQRLPTHHLTDERRARRDGAAHPKEPSG